MGTPTGIPTSAPSTTREQVAPSQAPETEKLPTLEPFVQDTPQTASPTRAPTRCTVSNGSFGATLGDPASVMFGYEVETDPNLQSGPLDVQVLPPLEEAMTRFLLPVLFPDTCGVESTTTRMVNRRRLEVIGINSRPDDKISPGVQCNELDDENNNCAFVDGELTMNYVLRGTETQESFVSLILDRLRFGMDSDAFLPAHPSIVRVTFIVGVEGTDVVDRDPNDTDDSIDWWPWLVIGGVLFIACCGLIAFRMSRTPRDFAES